MPAYVFDHGAIKADLAKPSLFELLKSKLYTADSEVMQYAKR
jgi:hypothetical protein